jgi:heme exporter protein CcmD
VIALLAAAPALPLGKAGKFVAGAYIVAFVVILIYVAIMAVRAQRTERELDQLRRDVEAARAGAERPTGPAPRPGSTGAGDAPDGPASAGDPERSGSLR